jgi:hypothetical protein
MATFSDRQAAKQLEPGPGSLNGPMSANKISTPKTMDIGDLRLYPWSERDSERVRKLLHKIEHGKKLRYENQRAE